MLLDLDHDKSLDPTRVGFKASRLASGRKAGLPILPGFIVSAEASRPHMRLGAKGLALRGSGGARVAVTGEPVTFAADLISAGTELGPSLVVRSSTALEGSGEWAGAFTSYLNLSPTFLPKAVTGCWAAAFSVDALERQRAASIQPGSFPMPVLVQSALRPKSGGVAELDSDGTVVVHGVEGSPVPLLQGWVGGHRAHLSGGERQMEWVGSDLIELVGTASLDVVAASLHTAQRLFGLNRCEWAVDGDVWILQLDVTTPPTSITTPIQVTKQADPDLVRIVQTVMRAPGKLGEELIMPWALAGLPRAGRSINDHPEATIAEAKRLSGELASQVWGLPPNHATRAARRCMSWLRGSDPSKALERLRDLRPPDPNAAAKLTSLVQILRGEMVRLGVVTKAHEAWYLSVKEIAELLEGGRRPSAPRAGIDRWEPFVASVVLTLGASLAGTPASSGIGAGVHSRIDNAEKAASFVSRGVIVADQPVPGLAPLLWDAAGLVTETGSSAAHLFQSARSLGIPAVSGVSLPSDSEHIVAVDGYTGLVATIPLYDKGVSQHLDLPKI
ncbi:MAG: PEP-utilizing enzyme [Acidimicrobiia bacterium]